MRRFDLTPLMRNSIGFDHLSRLLDQTLSADTAPSYPPYNIEKLNDDDYQITMAVAGFSQDELSVMVDDNCLTIAGRALEETDERTYLHKGIAKRAFERRFELADTVRIGTARLNNGLLEIALQRVIPEHKKPREIKIEANESLKAASAQKTDKEKTLSAKSAPNSDKTETNARPSKHFDVELA